MSFSIQPIGGLGQIGSNMMVIRSPSKRTYVIDCGILFPFEDTFNINYLIPNFENIEKPEFVIITHGHEDHIGAITHLLEKFPGLKVYAPPFAAELIRKKVDFYPRKLSLKLHTNIKEVIVDNDISFEYIQVNHSIPDTFGIVIKNLQTQTGVFYVSDFKVDEHSIHEPVFDFEKLNSSLSKCKKKILLADSTNITSSQIKTSSEQDLIPAFSKFIQSKTQRIFVTTFSSNIHRLLNLYYLAKENNRKFVLYGRSMRSYWETAVKTKIIPKNLKVYDVDDVNPSSDRLLVCVSGCQGDFRSTFRRIAYDQDSKFKLNKYDTFLLSSKAIPGNEKRIYQCLNELSLREVSCITNQDELIHASGHAGREDLLTVINKTNPDTFIPIHGETFFLKKHSEWVRSQKTNIRSFNILNFDIFDFEKEHSIFCQDPPQPIIIQGNGHELSREHVKERRKIAESGLIFISLFKNHSNQLDFSFNIQGHNILNVISEEKLQKLIENIVNGKKNKVDSEDIRVSVRKLIKDLTGIRPVVVVMMNI